MGSSPRQPSRPDQPSGPRLTGAVRANPRQPATTRANPCQHGKTATIEKTGFGPDRTSGSLAQNRHQCLKERCPVKTIAT